MQVRKVAVVATGALATAAAMGSTPAFAADNEGSQGGVAPAAVGLLDNQNRASEEAMREVADQWLTAAPEGFLSAPWDYEPPQILSVGSGSAASVAPWQHCGSTGPWILGATVPVASPATVLGDCRNGNIDVQGDGDDALFSVLDNTALSALSWQMCGSGGVGGLGVNVPIASPSTVTGDCDNGNITVSEGSDDDHYYKAKHHEPKDYKDYKKDYDHTDYKKDSDYTKDYPYHNVHHAEQADQAGNAATAANAASAEQAPRAGSAAKAEQAPQTEAAAEALPVPEGAPWDYEPPQILSAGSGSALSLAPWQHCGSTGPWILGATVPVASPATVLGDCRNGNIDITGDGEDALFSLLDNTAVSALSWQMCGSGGVGGAGINVPIASPSTVTGNCDNGNITVSEG